MGNRELRKLLVAGAHAVLYRRRPQMDPWRMWAKTFIEKKPFKLAAVSLGGCAVVHLSTGPRPRHSTG